MIRLTALNDDTSKSSEELDIHPKEPPEEVQEENALKVYNEALQEQRTGNTEKAEELYRQLLASNLLMKVKADEDNVKAKPDTISSIYSKPTHMLKYSCLKNMAVISQKKNLLTEALDYYTQALELESTDVSMWYQTGCLAMRLLDITTALEAFLKGLECSSKHWPSLDKLIMCLFTLHDYVNCLHFISRAFDLDVHYTRGQVLRDYILTEQPSLEHDIKLFFPNVNLHVNVKNGERQEIKDSLLQETLRIREKYSEKCRSQSVDGAAVECFVPTKKIKTVTWSDLGENLLVIQDDLTSQERHSLLVPIDLKNVLPENQPTIDASADTVSQAKGSCENPTVNNDNEVENVSEKTNTNVDKKSKKNRGSTLMEELLWGGKRRSARVRSSLRGNPEPMDVAEALRRILPRKLLHKTKQLKVENNIKGSALEEDSMDTMDLYRLFEKQESAEEKRLKEELERCEVEHDIDKIVEGEGYFGTNKESADVLSFIDSISGKNIIEIIKAFVMSLETHWKKTWPNVLPNVYMKCYQVMRRYHPLDFKMCTTESNFKTLVEESGCILLYGELYLEHWSNNRNKNDQKTDTTLPIIFLQHVMVLTDRKDVFENDEKYFEFLLRLYWLRCRIFLGKGQTSLAIVALNDLLACYELFPQFQSTVIELKNCRKHNVISNAVTEEFLAYQSRKRSLAEVVRLYEDESYRELTEILKETFTTASDTASHYFKEQESELVDRQTQLSMLINGLYHLNEYKECIYWLETCCYEVLQKSTIQMYTNENEESWMVAFDRLLVAIEDCLKLGRTTITETLPSNRVSRFVQTLCHAICKELEDSDRPPCPARPWIMLNTILIGLEGQEKPETAAEGDEEDENDIPSSILILFTAHEYLGRREWCNCNESVLLFLIMDQVIPQIRNLEWASFRETIQQHLEQVVYCLYTHPSKKTKARYLTDHNVNSIGLTWERGIQLFDLFRPDETPAYDSLRVNLISSDTEILFRRIAALIPDEKDPDQISDQMMDFIIGKRNDVPISSVVKLPEIAQDLFYILGDYYFKTHEFGKAVKYLLMDLCANPDRVDSWASMALARASILEQQLNSCDPLKDEIFLQDALAALRCYEHCLQLDNKQCALWIEYGSFVYTIHSFCSQRMKLESDSLSLEQFEELESTKDKMLETAKQAFVNANLIWYEMKEEIERQDERWLHHYMLGKICEKNGDLTYFEHYEKAAELLYENEAEFPSKVGYNTPQTLAIEALEVYYRVHVCVIKNLELNEGKPLDPKTRQLFAKHLNLCAKGPFAKQVSKQDLAKKKAKELEAAQNEKNMNAIKSVLNAIITKIENEAKLNESSNIKTEASEPQRTPEEKKVDEEDDVIIVEEPKKETNAMDTEDEIQVIDVVKKEEDVVEVEMKEPEKIAVESIKTEEKVPVEDTQKSVAKAVETIVEVEKAPVVMPLALDFRNYKRVDTSDDNYYITLDDLRNMPQPAPKPKKKRRLSHASVSSSSCGSEEIRYDDDSSSNSSTSESSASSQSSSSSSSDSSESTKERKTTDEEDKQNKEKDSGVEEKEGTSDEAPDDSENNMLRKCLAAFETCALRFPQHYKSVYRLAHFYYRSKAHRDINKCRDLLLGRYQTPNGYISGLFAERKSTNFFNGIWRIPAGDVDRPGSFASHMSRSILLLMEVLRDLKDHKMLLEICVQLMKTPEPDKKYLREDERNQLFVQACNLTIQTLRKNVKDSPVMTLPMVLDCYRCYQKVQKHYSNKLGVFGDILLEAFKRLGKGDSTLDQAIRFCHSEVSTNKMKIPKNPSATPPSIPKPKAVKLKKPEKKKSTPKPQITAKVVQKAPRKPYEKKKNPLNVPTTATDSPYWQSVLKTTPESKSQDMNAQMYAELLRAGPVAAKQMEKKITDQMALKNMVEQLRSNPNMIPDQSKPNPYYGYQNYPVEYGGEMYKQLLNNYWYNNPYAGGLYNQLQNAKKNKSKPVKPRSVLKPKPNILKVDTPKPNIVKVDAPKPNVVRVDAPKPNVVRVDAPKPNVVRVDTPKPNVRVDAPKLNVVRADAPKPNVRVDAPKPNVVRADVPKPNIVKVDTPRPNIRVEAPKPDESKTTKTNFNIEDILGKPSKLPAKSQPSTSTLSKSIEEKIRSISGEVNITKYTTPAPVINLAAARKVQTEQTGVKRVFPDNPDSAIIKKVCQRPEPQQQKKEEIEVVLIDD